MKKRVVSIVFMSTLILGLGCETPLLAHSRNHNHRHKRHRVSRGGKIGIGALFGFGGGAAIGGAAGGGKWAAGGGIIGLGVGAAIAALATRKQKREEAAQHTNRQREAGTQ